MLDLAIPLILGLTTLTALSGLLSEDGDSTDNDKDESPDDHPDDAGRDLPYIELDPLHEGSYVGSEVSETIVVNAETSFETAHLWDKYEEEMPSPLDIRGGGGDDVLVLQGRGYVVHGDEGNDLIELREASNVAVYAGSGDTVLGGLGTGNYINLEDDAVFIGGSGNDLVHSSSTASTHLGDGNDTYIGLRSPDGSGDVASIVYGGNGDDYLVGSMRSENLWWEHANDSGLISVDSDYLFGGAGDDTILGSHGDYIAGGSGDDCFIIVLCNDPAAPGATISDFKQGEDRVEIRYEVLEEDGITNTSSSVSHESFRTEHSPADGFTVLSADGQVIAHFEDAAPLIVGFQAWDQDSAAFVLVGLDGSPIALDECDIVIRASDTSSQ